MDFGITQIIVAIVTTDREFVQGGFSPVFYAKDDKHKEKLALLLSKTTQGMVHEIEPSTLIIVRH